MKKIIQTEEAKNYICPMAMANEDQSDRCIGLACMKWEDETVIKMSSGSSMGPPVPISTDEKTGRGRCGL